MAARESFAHASAGVSGVSQFEPTANAEDRRGSHQRRDRRRRLGQSHCLGRLGERRRHEHRRSAVHAASTRPWRGRCNRRRSICSTRPVRGEAFADEASFRPNDSLPTETIDGSFEGLAPFLGSAISGRGRIGGTVAIAVEANRIVVVGSNLSMPGATLRGVPIDRASVTLAVEGDRLRIYSAHARAAGGDVVAAGTLSLSSKSAGASSSNALSLVADRLTTSQLHGIGLPLQGGTIYASGVLRAGARLPAFAGGVTVDNAHIAQFPIAGESRRRLVGRCGGAEANGRKDRRHVRSSRRHDWSASRRVPRVTRFGPTCRPLRSRRALRAFGLPNYMTDGSFNAQLLIGGRSLSPTIVGTIGVPAGDVNGLPFIDGRAAIAADLRGVSISDGSVLVGTTAARLGAVVRPGDVAMHVSAPRADLSDFNNFFDTGDTLAGTGGVRIAAASRNTRITSSGDIDVRGFRYRNLPIGDTRAVWSSARNLVVGALAIGGSEGELHARGSIGLAPPGPWLSTLEHSRFDLGAEIDHLDLSLWLPALGMQALPITGRASGQATVHGRFPQIDLRGNARVIGGTLGPLTLDTADLAVHAARERIVIDRAELTTPELSASAAGSLGPFRGRTTRLASPCRDEPPGPTRLRCVATASPDHGILRVHAVGRWNLPRAQPFGRFRRYQRARVWHPDHLALWRGTLAGPRARAFGCRRDLRARRGDAGRRTSLVNGTAPVRSGRFAAELRRRRRRPRPLDLRRSVREQYEASADFSTVTSGFREPFANRPWSDASRWRADRT